MALKFARTTSFTRKLKFERGQYLDHKGKSQQLTVWEEVCWTPRHDFYLKVLRFFYLSTLCEKKIYHSCALRGMSKKSCDPFVKKKIAPVFCFVFCLNGRKLSCGLTYRLEDVDLENCSVERGNVMVSAVKY